MIDLHCHIIPGADDGARSTKESLNMCKIAKEDGRKIIFATAHFSPSYNENHIDFITDKVRELQMLLDERDIEIKLIPCQEVHIRKKLIEYIEEGRVKTLNGTKYLLLELPFDKLPEYALDIIYELGIRDIIPIIAHPERYDYVMKDTTALNPFIEEGCLFQVNAMSLRGGFGRKVQKTAVELLENNLIDFIASDAHNTERKNPVIRDVIEALEPEHKKRIMNNYDNLINNTYNLEKHKTIKKKGFLERLKSKFK